MILEEETYKKFGYYPHNLSFGSEKRILVSCDVCGDVREINNNNHATVCRSCSVKGKNHPNWHGGKIKRECVQCGTVFYVKPSNLKRGGGRFCSYRCRGAWQLGNRIKRVCRECGKIFYMKPCEIRYGKGLYCSKSCAFKHKKFVTHHTKPELIFESFCLKHNLPFKYVGDRSFWIGATPSINPDFVESNGKKLVVEIFGDYWHSPLLNRNLKEDRTLEHRKKTLKKYGYKMIVFWETDLKRKDAEQFVLYTLKKNGIS